MGERWDATLQALDAAISVQDLHAVESSLSALREMNRTFCIESTARYLRSLEAGR
jgi:hypothetical protein